MKQREVNIELLRIIAMLMVVSLHYMGKGGALIAFDGQFGANGWLAYIIESISIPAVNTYVLISGCMLYKADFKFERPLKICLQTAFYSILIFALAAVTTGIPEEFRALPYYFELIFPTAVVHYWFITSYIMLCLLSPFLNIALKNLNNKQHLILILILMAMFSGVWKILFPMSGVYDDKGYGIRWFVCLYVVGAYLGRYAPKFSRRTTYILIFTICCALILISFPVISLIYKYTGKLGAHTRGVFNYNNPLVLLEAIALFRIFQGIEIKSIVARKVIIKIAPLMLGVYIIHEHLLLRNLWTDFWKCGDYIKSSLFIPHYLGVTAAVFCACMFIEWLRTLLFSALYKTKPYKYLAGRLARVDKKING